MSAGFFGSYFRRSKEEEEQEGRPASAQERGPSPAAPQGAAPQEGGGGEPRPAPSPATPAGQNGAEDPAARLNGLLSQMNQEKASPTAVAEPPSNGTPSNGTPSNGTPSNGTPSNGAPPNGASPNGAAPEETAALQALASDPVAAALLQEGVLAMPQALLALREHEKEDGAELWRSIAGLSGVDRDKVFAVAAQVRGIETAKLSEGNPSDELVQAVCALLPDEVTKAMFALGLFPFAFLMDAAAEKRSLVLATHDPSHPDVATFTDFLHGHQPSLQVELRYAREEIVAGRIRRLLGSDYEDEPAPSAAEPEESSVPAAPEAAPPPADASTPNFMQMIQGDAQAPEGAPVENRIDPARPDLQGGDGYTEDLPQPAVPEASAPASPQPEAKQPEPPKAAPPSAPQPQAAPPPAEKTDPPAAQTQPAAPQPAPPKTETPSEPPKAEAPSGAVPSGAVPSEPPKAEPPKAEEPAAEAPEAEPAAAAEAEKEEGPSPGEIKAKDRVVTMLLRKGVVTTKQVADAQERQRIDKSKESLWRILAETGGVDKEAVYAEAAAVYAFPTATLEPGQPDPDFARSVVETFSEKHREELFKLRILPYECDLESKTGAIKLVFVTHDPTHPEVNRLMQALKLERFELRYASESVVMAAMTEVFPRKNEFLERMNEDSMALDIGTSFDEQKQLVDEEQLEAEIGRSALINLFEATLVEATRRGASDIHIYPNAKKKIEIHFRVDGRLSNWHTEEKVHPEAFLAVIKDNSTNVDRFERDAAQDGFIQRWIDDALIRFRVSILPIANASQEIHSESIVIRILDDRKVITDLSKLGLLPGARERFNNAIRQPHGMVILTGPTGSGKSTTLVASLHQVVTPQVNVLTVEDPVEYIIPGVRQIKLNHKLGLEEALRSILRHDPDVVMVGEMRDRHTAELAIKLANTGHLTFSTLHTNDAPSAVSRLYKMGIEPFLIGYAINLVVAQRLIRTLCPDCKQLETDKDPVMMDRLGFTEEEIASLEIYKETRDAKCSTCKGMGYKGRRAITEALFFSRAIRHLIVEAQGNIDEGAIRELATQEGMLTLTDSAREIVKMGETSLLEMIRVVTSES